MWEEESNSSADPEGGASFFAICNAMCSDCSRHKYCKLIKQAKSFDMQFMHVIIAVSGGGVV